MYHNHRNYTQQLIHVAQVLVTHLAGLFLTNGSLHYMTPMKVLQEGYLRLADDHVPIIAIDIKRLLDVETT